MDIKKNIEDLIDTFLEAGELSLSLREKGLKKQIKSDNTPVSNGDLEVNEFITKKISEITPDIPIISEETSDNKDNTQLKDFWLVDPIDGTSLTANGSNGAISVISIAPRGTMFDPSGVFYMNKIMVI